MKSILFCFPPLQRGSQKLYFRTQQLFNSLKKEFKVNKIDSLAKTGSAKEKKLTLKKNLTFILKLPFILRQIKKTNVLIIFPSPIWFFWLTLGKFFRKKVVMDHFVTSLSPMGKSKLPKVLKKPIFLINRFFYQKVDLIITHTKTMKKQIALSFNINKDKIITVYSVVDVNLFNPDKFNKKQIVKIKQKFNIPLNKKILLYHGESHEFHGLNIIKKIAEKSFGKDNDLIFVFVGGKEKNYENRYYIGYLEFEDLPQVLAMADLWLGRFDNSYLAKRAASSCMMQAMAMKIPIITYATQENRKIIQNGINGLIIKTLNSSNILKLIKKLLKNKTKLKQIGTNARQTIIKNYSLKEWVKINKIIKEL